MARSTDRESSLSMDNAVALAKNWAGGSSRDRFLTGTWKINLITISRLITRFGPKGKIDLNVDIWSSGCLDPRMRRNINNILD